MKKKQGKYLLKGTKHLVLNQITVVINKHQNYFVTCPYVLDLDIIALDDAMRILNKLEKELGIENVAIDMLNAKNEVLESLVV